MGCPLEASQDGLIFNIETFGVGVGIGVGFSHCFDPDTDTDPDPDVCRIGY